MKKNLLVIANLLVLTTVAHAASSATSVVGTKSIPLPAAPVTVTSASPAAAPPDPSANPVLANIQRMGGKFYYLGNRYGLDGWFVVKQGQVQIVYMTPDNKGALVGAMFGQDGENVSVLQVNSLMQSNAEVAALISSASKEQVAISQVGSPPAPAPTSSSSAAAPAMPSMNLSPGERLLHDLGGAANVMLGNPSSPEIMMIMDPRCPHCQATWKALRDVVVANKIHVRMVPIATEGSQNERAATVLLALPNPIEAWDKYVAGDEHALSGESTPAALAAVRANGALVDRWKISNTPYLVYRGKDGKVKVMKGEPEKLSVLLADVGL